MDNRKRIPDHDHSAELEKINPHRWMQILLDLLAEQRGVELTDVVITTAAERKAMAEERNRDSADVPA